MGINKKLLETIDALVDIHRENTTAEIQAGDIKVSINCLEVNYITKEVFIQNKTGDKKVLLIKNNEVVNNFSINHQTDIKTTLTQTLRLAPEAVIGTDMFWYYATLARIDYEIKDKTLIPKKQYYLYGSISKERAIPILQEIMELSENEVRLFLKLYNKKLSKITHNFILYYLLINNIVPTYPKIQTKGYIHYNYMGVKVSIRDIWYK